MSGVDVGGEGRLQQRALRRPVVRLRLDAGRAAATPVGVGMVLAGLERRRVRARDAGGGHATPPQDVGQHGGALHVLHQKRDHVGQFGLPQGVAEGARPVDVVYCWMGVLEQQHTKYLQRLNTNRLT
mgnify:FL=1